MTNQTENPSSEDLDLVASLADATRDRSDLWNEFDATDDAALKAGEDETDAGNADDDGGDENADLSGDDGADGGADDNQDQADAGEGTKDGQKQGQGDETPDLWASAPEELKSAYEAMKSELEHKVRSEQGRARSFQQKLNEASRSAQPQAKSQQGSAADRLAALKEEFPDLVEPLSEALGIIEGQVSQLSQNELSRQQAAEQELIDHVRAETETLTHQHPDYQDVVKENRAAFDAWLDDQPGPIRRAAERNGQYIQDAAEAAEVIAQFKAFLKPPAETPAADQTRSQQQPAQLSAKRERQLQGSAAPRNKGGRPTVSGIPEEGDRQAIWDAWDRQDSAQSG